MVCGCVLVYARTHTQTTWVLAVSPGVGQTPRLRTTATGQSTHQSTVQKRVPMIICLIRYHNRIVIFLQKAQSNRLGTVQGLEMISFSINVFTVSEVVKIR